MGVRDEISELITEYCKAVDNQNAPGVANFYAEQTRFLPPNGPMIESRAGVDRSPTHIGSVGARLGR